MSRWFKALWLVSVMTVATYATTKTVIHKIKKGESLSIIAKQHHTTVTTLCKLNGISKGTVLRRGKGIKVPAISSQHKPKHYAHKHSTHKTHLAKRQRRSEKRLARALARFNASKVVKVHIRRRSKTFTLNDIVYGTHGVSHEKLSPITRRIIALAKQKLGRRYVWGATGQRNTFDCSGLTSYVCKMNGIKIPRRAIQQSKFGKPVKRSELQPGDLIFFDTSKHRRGYVNHVGIYIGHGKFIHASSAKKKVIITSLKKPFYSQRFKGARRVASL